MTTRTGWFLCLCALFVPTEAALAQRALVNFSTRLQVGTGTNAGVANFMVEGTSPKTVLIRAVGPGLSAFGVSGVLADPVLTVYDGSGAVVASNDNWGGSAALKTAFTAVGAFALSDGSRDAAALFAAGPGLYSVHITGVGNTTGVALVEFYDTDANSRIPFLAMQQPAGTGAASMVLGLVVAGSVPQTVLIRALGPGLTSYGHPGALANPTLTVTRNSTVIGTNDDWGGATEIVAAAATAGLSTLPAGSRDSALLLGLAPGSYTVQVSSATGATGLVRAEIAQIDGNRAASFAPMFFEPPPYRTPAAIAPQTVTVGSPAAFRIPSFLAKPIAVSYQWRKDGTNIPGATAAALQIASAQTGDRGSYTVALTNSAGTTTSAAATLTVIPAVAPVITEQPIAQAVAPGGTVTFAVAATGNPAPAFQWLRNGAPIPGATGSSLLLSNTQPEQAGEYAVRVSNVAGTVTSSAVTLTVVTAASISRALHGLRFITELENSSGLGPGALAITFVVEGRSSKSIVTAARRYDSVNPTTGVSLNNGLADPILTVYDRRGVSLVRNDNWGGTAALKAALSGAAGVIRPSSDASLDAALMMTLPPGAYTAVVSAPGGMTGQVEFGLYEADSVESSRIAHLSMQGNLTASHTINLSVVGAADVLVRALGPALAATGITGVMSNPTITFLHFPAGQVPVLTNDDWGGGSNLSDAARNLGLLPLASGSRDAALLTSVSLLTGSYGISDPAVSRGNGMVEIAQIDAERTDFLPALLMPPGPVVAAVGSTATLAAPAIGRPLPTFQWRKDGADIPGATNPALTLAGFRAADAGTYAVVMTNSLGSTTSGEYVVTVAGSPTITMAPMAQQVRAGETATLTAAAGGNPPLTYQWLRNGVAVSGATSATLTIPNVQAANAGAYSLRVTNSSGSVLSTAVALSVISPPTIAMQPTEVSVPVGRPATFTVAATGSAQLTFQWRRDGLNIAGATNTTFALAATQSTDAGSYTCVVTNSAGSVTTEPVRLTVTRSIAGTYFGTFDGGRGNWAMIVSSDGVGTYVAFLSNPQAGIVAAVSIQPDGTFRTESALLQPAGGPQVISSRPVAAAGVPFTLTGAIGATTVTGSLEGLGISFTGALDPPGGVTAPISGLYQANSATTTTYTVVGSNRTVVALTVGPTLVDGGIGSVGSNGTFTVGTPGGTQVAGTVTTTGTITTTVTPPAGTATTATGSATGGLGPPTIASAPAARTVTVGSPVALAVTVGGTTPLTYQWTRNGVAISGATSAALAIPSVQFTDAGNYACVIANAEGNATTSSAGLTVIAPNATFPTAGLVNLSIRSTLRTAGDSFTLGYVVGGEGAAGPKPFVIRAVGPSLAALGVSGTLDDPRLELFVGAAKTGENDNWGGDATLTAAFARVGAFPLSAPTSRDAALLVSIVTSQNSARVSATGNGTGEVIAELYDAASADPAAPRLVNVSVLKHLGSGLTAGFVIAGTGTRNVLVRAVGPTLGSAPFNVGGVVADPQLTLYSGQTAVGSNDNWGGTAELTAAFSAVGAFALPAVSRDAALLASLQPGAYTVQVSGVGNTTGVAIVEVYEVP